MTSIAIPALPVDNHTPATYYSLVMASERFQRRMDRPLDQSKGRPTHGTGQQCTTVKGPHEAPNELTRQLQKLPALDRQQQLDDPKGAEIGGRSLVAGR